MRFEPDPFVAPACCHTRIRRGRVMCEEAAASDQGAKRCRDVQGYCLSASTLCSRRCRAEL